MSLFDSASLVVTPNGTKASKLYAIKPTDASGDLSVTRATTATRVNSSGLIESVANNVPRLDYTNSTCPSILVEPQRTNVINYSNNFLGANWSSLSNTITPNYAISPDGTQNATRLQSTKANSSLDSYLINIFTDLTNGCKSIYIKGVSSGGTMTLGSSTITFTTEWKRYSVVDAYPYFLIGARAGFNNIDVLIYGAQLEAGSYATSYIPTVASSVTRNADLTNKTGISSLIGQTEGVMYFDLKSIANNDFKRLSINGGSYVNSIFFDFDNSNSLYAKIFVGGSAVATLLASGVNIANRNKIAIAYKNNDFSFYVNGTQVASQSSGSIPSGLANYEFSLAGNQIFEGNINAAALWKTRLSNTELATLTTI